MEESLWPVLLELARPYLATRGNQLHVEVSLARARVLLAEEGGQPAVVYPAVILHDVGWSCVPEEMQLQAFGPLPHDRALNRVHEVEGVRLAAEILERAGYPCRWRQEILAIVDNHDSVAAAVSLNDALVKDADKLFRFSPQGFALDCTRFRLDPADYWRRLRGWVDEWMLTPTGARLAREDLVRLREHDYGRGE